MGGKLAQIRVGVRNPAVLYAGYHTIPTKHLSGNPIKLNGSSVPRLVASKEMVDCYSGLA